MSTQTIEKVDANIEQELNLVLVRNNLTEEKLAALNDRAMKHGGEIVSEAQYKEVLAVSQEIGKDVAIAKKNLKAMDRHRIDSNNAWRLMIQEVSAKVEEPLVLIGVPMAAYRAKKAKEEEDRATAIKQENDEREQKVIELGFVRHPGPPEHRYILEDMVVGITSIINVPHDVWTNTFNDMRMKSEEVNAAKAEREAMDRLDAAMAEQRQREQDAREAELAQREADLKQKEEAASAKLNESRKNELLALGCEDEGYRVSVFYNDRNLFLLFVENLHTFSDAQWSDEILAAKAAIEERNLIEKEAQEKAAREALVNERVEKLKAAGWLESPHPNNGEMAIGLQGPDGSYTEFVMVDNLYQQSEETFGMMLERGRAETSRRQQEADKAARKKMEDEFAERQEAERLQAIEDEAKRVAALGDAERWTEWVAIIKNSKPEMVGETSKRAVDAVIAAIEGPNH